MLEVNSPKKKPRRSRPVLVADAIKEWVVKRDLSSGDKLPNESAMIDQFGVSKRNCERGFAHFRGTRINHHKNRARRW